MIKNSINFKAYLALLPACLFAVIQFFLQTSGNVILPDLKSSFGINDAQVGFLFSAFFWGYVIAQIPAGLFLDFLGSRKVLIISAAALCISCFVFAFTKNYYSAFICRAVMGFASGFAFVGCIFVVAEYFPAKRFALILGLNELAAMIITAVGQAYTSNIVKASGWRALMLYIALFMLITIILMYLYMYKRNEANKSLNNLLSDTKTNIAEIVKNPLLWIIGLYSLGTFACLTAFVDVWGGVFLAKTYNLHDGKAEKLITWVLVGIAVGGPVTGWLSEKYNIYKLMMSLCSFLSLILAVLMIFPIHFINMNILLAPMLFALGFCSSVYLISFAVAKQAVSGNAVGVVSAFVNVIALFGAVVFQPATGWLLTNLPESEFKLQLSIICFPAAVLIAFLCSLFIKSPQKN